MLTGNVNMMDYALDGNTLTIRLDQPLSESGSVSIAIVYTLTPRLQGGILGYTARQLNLSDWYPFIPPFDPDSGWIIHQPAEVGEYLVYDSADFDLTLNLVNATGLTVAASAEAAPLDLDSYRIIQNNARGITFSVSDQYTLLTNTTNGITVKGYIFKGDEVAGQAAVDYTANALQLYSELFGLPYPHQTLSVVESDFPDGMEFDGLYYLSDFYFKNYDGTFQNYLALLTVHETSHQWWFGVVGNDQALEPWLDESLATYSEYLYIERYYPELTNWWWDYRVNYYKPAGRVNLTIYDQYDLRVYINAVYLQGAVFLDQLRQDLGDDAFFAGLRTYTNSYSGKLATWNDFVQIMAPTSTDLIETLFQEI
ncbi:MAG: M1 family aminopeptidase, partial [Anaerolineaceae bacterium]|nr:M1 family aminopeptidase [Anaerolineaceae bacterium]